MRKRTPSSKDVIHQSPHLKSVLSKAHHLIKIRSYVSGLLPLELQSQCHVANYREGVLIIYVTGSVWATRLRLLSPHLLKRLQLVDAFSALAKIDVKVKPDSETQRQTLAAAKLSNYGKATLADIKRTLKNT